MREFYTDKFLFWLSGLIACGTTLFLFVFFYFIFTYHKLTKYDINLENQTITIDLETLELPKNQKIEEKPKPTPAKEIEPKKIETKEEPIKKEIKDTKVVPQEAKKQDDLKNIFKNIDAKKFDDAKSKADEKRNAKLAQEVRKKQEAIEEKNKKIKDLLTSKNVENIDLSKIKSINQNISASSAKIKQIGNNVLTLSPSVMADNKKDSNYNEWINEVYSIIYKNWDIAFFRDTVFKAMIIINEAGDFNYIVQQYSSYEEFNNSITGLLEYLKTVKFPVPPDNKSFKLEVNFKTKEK